MGVTGRHVNENEAYSQTTRCYGLHRFATGPSGPRRRQRASHGGLPAVGRTRIEAATRGGSAVVDPYFARALATETDCWIIKVAVTEGAGTPLAA